MTATFAQIPIVGDIYTSVAQELPIYGVLAISNNMGSPGSHHITVGSTPGYYRVAANLQISGTVGSQAIFWFRQKSGATDTIVNQYQLDVVGNMVVSFETVVYGNVGDYLSLFLTVSTNGAVVIDSTASAYSPSALFAYLID